MERDGQLIARARGGIGKLAREADLNREALHCAPSEGCNPMLDHDSGAVRWVLPAGGDD